VEHTARVTGRALEGRRVADRLLIVLAVIGGVGNLYPTGKVSMMMSLPFVQYQL
jgi:hypothetical protein